MTPAKSKTLINFKKTRSLLTKIIQMLEDDQYCIDIMQQNLAAIGLLKSAHQQLLENHLATCFHQAMKSKNQRKKQAMIQEILKVTNLFNR